MTAFLIKGSDVELDPQPLGPGYSGPETYLAGGEFSTGDGAVTGGIWAYDGRLVSANAGKAHQLWIVLSGELRLELEGRTMEARSGDVLLLEAPYPGKTLDASPDFRAVWIGVERRS